MAHRERVESDGVEEALLNVADSYVQLLTPTRDDSPVAKYLANKGEGLHHVGYRVEDCAVALQAVKDAGGRVIDEAPRPGLAGHDGGLRAPQDVVRHADRAGPGVGQASSTRCGEAPPDPLGGGPGRGGRGSELAEYDGSLKRQELMSEVAQVLELHVLG